MNLLCCCCCCCTMAPNTRVTRKWELYAGRNKFYCDGLLMSAPHTGVFYLTCVLITGTSALFFAFDCPFLANRITPAIPIVGAVLYFFTMSSLLRTTFTDPGVIPRASHDEAAYIEKQIEVPNSLNSPTYRPPPRTKEVLVKGQTVKLKYCFTCKIFRPPRASHCSLCDNCVDRFDHHCPWVGNCVGKRNYRFFYMFLVSLAFLAVFIFSCSVTHLVLLMKIEQEVFEVIKKAPFTVIVVFICFFSIWSVIGLAGFHTYLTTSDQTTNEDLKGSFSSKGGQRAINPYSRGNICLNCCHILCGPMTPSLIDRRGIATDEYILQMQQQTSPRHPLSDVISATHVSSGAMITNQPMLGSISGSGISGAELKPRLYDESNINSSTIGGVYRPRSYENLQNGNSNSLAHLVDNEIPLSQIESPQSQSQTHSHAIHQPSVRQHHQRKRQQQPNAAGITTNSLQDCHDRDTLDDANALGRNMDNNANINNDDDDVVVVDNNEVIAAVAAIAATYKATKNRNHLSGSYSNLFNAEYDATTTSIVTPPTSPSASANVGAGVGAVAAAAALAPVDVGAAVAAEITAPSDTNLQYIPHRPDESLPTNTTTTTPTTTKLSNATTPGRYFKGSSQSGLAAVVSSNLPTSSLIDDQPTATPLTAITPLAYNNQQSLSNIPQTESMYINVPTNNMASTIDDADGVNDGNVPFVAVDEPTSLSPPTPPTILTPLVGNISIPQSHNSISPIVENQSIHHDSNVHVYSNLIEERQQQLQQQQHHPSQLRQLQRQQQQQQQQLSRITAIGLNSIENNHTTARIFTTSSLLDDDLDLDDPVSASFVVHTTASQSTPAAGPASSSAVATALTSNKQSTSAITTKLMHHHAKRKMGVVSMDPLKTLTSTKQLLTTSSLNSSSTSSVNDGKVNAKTDLTPSRLRLLHDTTMIDTALDLDSIDGSIQDIGNNPQMCLMKEKQQLQHQH